MVVSAPERSLEQRLIALERANEVRTSRARLKRNIKSGRIGADKIIADPPDFMDTMKLMDLMLVIPKYGRVKVHKILTQLRISPSKTLGGLSERQRDEIIFLLRNR